MHGLKRRDANDFDSQRRSFVLTPDVLFEWVVYLKLQAPEWCKKDKACQHCAEKFKRAHKHNCRLCGGLFCSLCTQLYCLPPEFYKKRRSGPTRVCLSCRNVCLAARENYTKEFINLRPRLRLFREPATNTELIIPPHWTPIEHAASCAACGIIFQNATHFHHCRVCGHCFCPCCCVKTRHPIPQAFRKKRKNGSVRVCNECRFRVKAGARLVTAKECEDMGIQVRRRSRHRNRLSGRPGHSRHPSRQHHRAPSTGAQAAHAASRGSVGVGVGGALPYPAKHSGHGRRISMPALGKALDLEALAKEDRESGGHGRYNLKDLQDLEFRTSQRSLFSAPGALGGSGSDTPPHAQDKEMAAKLAQVSFHVVRSNASAAARMHIESRHSRSGSRSRNSVGHVASNIAGGQGAAAAAAGAREPGHSRSRSRSRHSTGHILSSMGQSTGALSELPPLEGDGENDRTQQSVSKISLSAPNKRLVATAPTSLASGSNTTSTAAAARSQQLPPLVRQQLPLLSRGDLHKRHESTSTSSLSSFSASRSSVSSSDAQALRQLRRSPRGVVPTGDPSASSSPPRSPSPSASAAAAHSAYPSSHSAGAAPARRSPVKRNVVRHQLSSEDTPSSSHPSSSGLSSSSSSSVNKSPKNLSSPSPIVAARRHTHDNGTASSPHQIQIGETAPSSTLSSSSSSPSSRKKNGVRHHRTLDAQTLKTYKELNGQHDMKSLSESSNAEKRRQESPSHGAQKSAQGSPRGLSKDISLIRPHAAAQKRPNSNSRSISRLSDLSTTSVRSGNSSGSSSKASSKASTPRHAKHKHSQRAAADVEGAAHTKEGIEISVSRPPMQTPRAVSFATGAELSRTSRKGTARSPASHGDASLLPPAATAAGSPRRHSSGVIDPENAVLSQHRVLVTSPSGRDVTSSHLPRAVSHQSYLPPTSEDPSVPPHPHPAVPPKIQLSNFSRQPTRPSLASPRNRQQLSKKHGERTVRSTGSSSSSSSSTNMEPARSVSPTRPPVTRPSSTSSAASSRPVLGGGGHQQQNGERKRRSRRTRSDFPRQIFSDSEVQTPSTPLRPRTHFAPLDTRTPLPDLSLAALPSVAASPRYKSASTTTTPRSAATDGRKKSRSRLSAILRRSVSKATSSRKKEAAAAAAAASMEISAPLTPRSLPVTPLSSVPSSAKSSRSPTPRANPLKRGSSFRELLSARKSKKDGGHAPSAVAPPPSLSLTRDRAASGDAPNGAAAATKAGSPSHSSSSTSRSFSGEKNGVKAMSEQERLQLSPVLRQIRKFENLERVSQVSLSRSFLKVTQPRKEKDKKMDLQQVRKELLSLKPVDTKALQQRSLPSSKSRRKSRGVKSSSFLTDHLSDVEQDVPPVPSTSPPKRPKHQRSQSFGRRLLTSTASSSKLLRESTLFSSLSRASSKRVLHHSAISSSFGGGSGGISRVHSSIGLGGAQGLSGTSSIRGSHARGGFCSLPTSGRSTPVRVPTSPTGAAASQSFRSTWRARPAAGGSAFGSAEPVRRRLQMSDSHVGGFGGGDFTRGRRHTVASPQPCTRGSEDVEPQEDADSDLSGDEGVDNARSGTDVDSDGDGSDAEQQHGAPATMSDSDDDDSDDGENDALAPLQISRSKSAVLPQAAAGNDSGGAGSGSGKSAHSLRRTHLKAVAEKRLGMATSTARDKVEAASGGGERGEAGAAAAATATAMFPPPPPAAAIAAARSAKLPPVMEGPTLRFTASTPPPFTVKSRS